MAGAYGTILSLLAERRVRPVVVRTVPLDEAAAGQRSVSQERLFGAVVLTF